VSGVAPIGQSGTRFVLEEPRAAARPAFHGPSSGPDAGLLATATYIVGTTNLEPGRRYAMKIEAARLRLLGSLDVEPTVIALELDVRDMDATSVGGRLLISQPGVRSGPVVAFMSIAGTTPDGLAATIVEAARAATSA
jgi:hypothetical protein